MKSDFDKNFYLFFLTRIKGISDASIWNFIQADSDKQGRVSQIISEKEKDKRFLQNSKSEFKKIQENYISILDDEYPALLKTIYDPPLFLFYRGNIKLLQNKNLLTMVGSRTLTTYHQTNAIKIVGDLANTDLNIVSGLAIGMDSVGHQAALDNKLPTIAVLGSGLHKNVLYPQSNIKLAQEIINEGGLLLSEYPEYSRPQLHYFPKRNRILAGLSKATVVISGALKSGTLITAQVALDEGRDIYALPGNINLRLSQGPNSLIANGANILADAGDILKTYSLKKSSSKNKVVFKNKNHAKIYTLLQTEPMNLEQLRQQLQVPLNSVSIIISELEIRGLVKTNQFNQVEII
ncbi:DNA-protecting protein DprA [Candidatus Parcubacteria bacterium]|jgi:DNA processing protein|nr:DNA-protecting protein DprA [Candidatus Parcubacteria bacterium]